MPFGFTAYLPPRPLLSQEAGEGQRGWWRKQSKRRATPSVLGEPGWSGKVGPKLPFHAGSEGLATFSPNFRGGLLAAAACSRTSLSGHWRL